MKATQLDQCRFDLDNFIEEYQKDKSDFWLHPIKEAINSIEYLKNKANQSIDS